MPPGSTRKALVVVSAFKPAMLADMQRARMLAWDLPTLGWRVEFLSPRASEIRQDAVDADSASFFPEALPHHEVGSVWRRLFESAGSRTHSWRTLLPMYRRGCELLASRAYDVVYITTTTTVYFMLGAWWKSRFGVPYVLDFHDPWVPDADQARGGTTPRDRLLAALSRAFERRSVVNASGLITVSPRYLDALSRRYAAYLPEWLAEGKSAVIPFGARLQDLATAARDAAPRPRRAETIRLVYVGAGGEIFARSLRLICRVLARLRRSGDPRPGRVRIELYGTTYGWRPGDPKPLETVAAEQGVGDLVVEFPGRITYRSSLELLAGADGALVLGVDDPGYMPSKLFPYALSGKPLLASLRKESPAYRTLRDAPALGELVWFDDSAEMPLEEACGVVSAFLESAANARTFDRSLILEPFLAPAMARRHAALFDRVATGSSMPSRQE
jgi:hypothetical protein